MRDAFVYAFTHWWAHETFFKKREPGKLDLKAHDESREVV